MAETGSVSKNPGGKIVFQFIYLVLAVTRHVYEFN